MVSYPPSYFPASLVWPFLRVRNFTIALSITPEKSSPGFNEALSMGDFWLYSFARSISNSMVLRGPNSPSKL